MLFPLSVLFATDYSHDRACYRCFAFSLRSFVIFLIFLAFPPTLLSGFSPPSGIREDEVEREGENRRSTNGHNYVHVPIHKPATRRESLSVLRRRTTLPETKYTVLPVLLVRSILQLLLSVPSTAVVQDGKKIHGLPSTATFSPPLVNRRLRRQRLSVTLSAGLLPDCSGTVDPHRAPPREPNVSPT